MRLLLTYIIHHQEINACYGYYLKHQMGADESAGWQKRTEFWLKDEA